MKARHLSLGLLPVLALLAGCHSTPPAPQVTPLNATIKLGHVTEKTFLTRIEVSDGTYNGYSVGVGAAGVSGGRGGGVGLGFSVDLTRLFSRPAVQQIDLFQYKVRTVDGAIALANAPALPGVEPGACVRLIYPEGSTEARLAPSNEC